MASTASSQEYGNAGCVAVAAVRGEERGGKWEISCVGNALLLLF